MDFVDSRGKLKTGKTRISYDTYTFVPQFLPLWMHDSCSSSRLTQWSKTEDASTILRCWSHHRKRWFTLITIASLSKCQFRPFLFPFLQNMSHLNSGELCRKADFERFWNVSFINSRVPILSVIKKEMFADMYAPEGTVKKRLSC